MDNRWYVTISRMDQMALLIIISHHVYYYTGTYVYKLCQFDDFKKKLCIMSYWQSKDRTVIISFF